MEEAFERVIRAPRGNSLSVKHSYGDRGLKTSTVSFGGMIAERIYASEFCAIPKLQGCSDLAT